MKKKIKGKYHWISKYGFHILVSLILLLAIFLRFYNIDNRWGIGNDSARDIAIALEALKRHEIPVSGPFSSAGPFVFGPVFYWILMASYILLPFSFLAPVMFTAIMGVAAVGIVMACGFYLGGKKLAIITGILAATSPQLVGRSQMVGQQSFIPVTASLLFLMFILFWQRKKIIYPFIMGIALACALSLHYQVINLLLFFPILFFVPGLSLRQKLSAIAIMFVGFLLPTIPFLIWDSQQHWANVNNILDYLLVGQYRIYVPNSWKLFIFNFLPTYWSMVTAGSHLGVSMVIMFFTFGSLFYYTVRKQISGILFALSVIFYTLLFINRYYKGERSEGYLVYLTPFIILFTGWAIVKLFSVSSNKLSQRLGVTLGSLFLALILTVNFISAKQYLKAGNSLPQINRTIEELEAKYPNVLFAIYDYEGRSTYQSQPLALFLKAKNKTSPNGIPIGVTCGSPRCLCLDTKCKVKMKQVTTLVNQKVTDLRSVKNLDGKNSKWVRVNQEDMYDDLIGWAKRHELKSTFNPQTYFLEKLGLK